MKNPQASPRPALNLSSISSFAQRLKEKNLHQWIVPWLRQASAAAARQALTSPAVPRHLLFCFCDHYEPEWGRPGAVVGEARVQRWQTGYPPAVTGFRDAEGRPPQHSFFFPGEEFRPAYLDRLTELCAAGYGEVELHLHHSQDTEAVLRDKLARYLDDLSGYGHFSRRRGRLRYAFIHGDWALANPNHDGRFCGVDRELSILFETGCYADYTFPSAPHPTQPRVVNQIYWPTGDLSQPRGYQYGEPARVGRRLNDRLLMIEGPLALSLRPGTLRPRIESAAVTAADPPTPARIRTWVQQGICVAGRPEWVFVKVHTHGAPEPQAEALLGYAGQMLHTTLTRDYNDGQRWVLHYVTAREMYNIACAAMDGEYGDPGRLRDYLLPPPPVRGASAVEQAAPARTSACV